MRKQGKVRDPNSLAKGRQTLGTLSFPILSNAEPVDNKQRSSHLDTDVPTTPLHFELIRDSTNP